MSSNKLITGAGEYKANAVLCVVIRLMLAAWVAMKVMSRKLWIADRSFPSIPLVSLPSYLHLVLFVLFFILAGLLFIRPLQPLLSGLLLITETISLLGDQLRWHPWEYQFLFICLAVLVGRKHPHGVINSIVFIFASSYFFSGLSKLSNDFLTHIWLRLMLRKVLHFPKAVYYNPYIKYSGLFIPFAEIGSGILLLLRKHFKITGWLPICVHLFIILYISPLLSNTDFIVFPWNVFMMSTVYLLVIRNETKFSLKTLFYKQNILIACAWTLLPIAGMFLYWPPFFSFRLYTGKSGPMAVYLPDTKMVVPEIAPYIRYDRGGYEGLHVYFLPFDWCNQELAVPIPPEKRIYKSLEDSLAERYQGLHPLFRYY